MAVELSRETEAIVRDLVASGAFPDERAVLDRAVSLLNGQREELKRLIQEGIDSGPSIPADVVFARLMARADEIARGAGSTR